MDQATSTHFSLRKYIRLMQDAELVDRKHSHAVEAFYGAPNALTLGGDALRCFETSEDVPAITDDSRTQAEYHGTHSASDSSERTSTSPHKPMATSLPKSIDKTLRRDGYITFTSDLDPSFAFTSEPITAVAGPLHVFGTCVALDELRSPISTAQCLDGEEDILPDEAQCAQLKNNDAHHPRNTAPFVTGGHPLHSSTNSDYPTYSKNSVFNPQAAMGAATLPQELFSIIIDAAGLLHRSHENKVHNSRSGFYSCSLVCVYWANRFRLLAYRGHHTIKSEQRARQLRDLVLGPCSVRLAPLVKLIGDLWVVADPTANRSWHHLLTSLVPLIPADKFTKILVLGSFQSRAPFRSIVHWGVPSSVSALPVPYRELRLFNLQFASLQHLVQLVRKLPRLQVLALESLKWDKDAPLGNTTPRQQARSVLTRVSVGNCQDATLLLLRLLLAGSARAANPLHVLPPSEQVAIIQLFKCFAAVNKAPYLQPRNGAFNHLPTLNSRSVISRSSIILQENAIFTLSLHFFHERTVSGCVVVFSWESSASPYLLAIAVDDSWSTLALFPDLRYLIIGLSGVDCIQVLSRADPVLWTSLAQRLRYFRFASQPAPRRSRKWVARDPVSLEMTGETWSEVHGRDPTHGEALDNIVLAQLEANRSTPDRCG